MENISISLDGRGSGRGENERQRERRKINRKVGREEERKVAEKKDPSPWMGEGVGEGGRRDNLEGKIRRAGESAENLAEKGQGVVADSHYLEDFE